MSVRWITEKQKHPACTIGWVASLCCSWLSPGKKPEFLKEEIPLGQYSCKKYFKKNSTVLQIARAQVSIPMWEATFLPLPSLEVMSSGGIKPSQGQEAEREREGSG